MSLIKELQQIHAGLDNSQKNDEVRRSIACEEAQKEIVSDFDNRTKAAAKNGHTQVKLIEWSFNDQRRFNECYLLDLLTKGDLCERLQNWLDEKHGAGNFKVYFTVPTHKNQNMMICVSWDPNFFKQIEERLKAIKDNTIKRRQQAPRKKNYISKDASDNASDDALEQQQKINKWSNRDDGRNSNNNRRNYEPDRGFDGRCRRRNNEESAPPRRFKEGKPKLNWSRRKDTLDDPQTTQEPKKGFRFSF